MAIPGICGNGHLLVVSLLHQYESQELDSSSEGSECLARGIEYRSFPIRDRDIPESVRSAEHNDQNGRRNRRRR